jgi:lipopolysaccharide/colanic/teichoic acid biosynthesis glycosyltransferase
VGPRPLAVHPDAFGTIDGARHLVRPGITGLWQVSGGNGLRYADMIALDFRYMRDRSVFLDIWLLVRTVPALVRRRDPA